MVLRAARAWRNDLENIPIFLILAWIYVAANLSGSAFVIYCLVASFTEDGITNPSTYLLDVTVAASLLLPTFRNRSTI